LRADDRALADLAASVADGNPVDWQGIESKAADAERRLVRHLRLVESIASLYRSIPADEDEALPGAEPAAITEPTGPRWGRLVMLDPIGRGSSGDVLRAWDTELHREVALKLLSDGPGARSTKDTHARVLQEARRLARVRHTHVVAVYGAEEHDGHVGLWMELVRGESLEQIVAARGPFGAAEAAVIGQDLCAALAAVHAAGLLHRDVKAQNVIRESGGRTVLMDFGTGEELRDNAGTARMAGTPLYLAPEIFRGQPASVESDLYSVGVLLFSLVTGQFPVAAASMEQLARAHAHKQRRRLRDLRPDLPASFVAVVERALDPDPVARYRTAGEMEAALGHGLDRFQPGQVATQPARSVFGRRPFLAAALAVAVLAVAVAAIVWSAGGRAKPVASRAITSVAVLPLADVSSTPSSPYFADALTDQLIATLGQIQSLRVASRTSVMPFKDSKPSITQVFDALGADAVVEGTVAVVAGDASGPGRVRVNARLISASSGGQLWSRSLERPLGDTLRLQADLARQIAEAVQATVTNDESRRLAQMRSTTAGAEEAYFLGRYHLGQYGIDRAQRALDAFKRAVQLDPGHAAAHAGAARSYFNLGFAGAMSQPEARAFSLAEITKALEIDTDQPDAQVALADLRFFYDWDWRGADAAYRRAIELNHSFAYAHGQYARFLAAARRLDEAAVEARTAAEVDPLSAESAQTVGLVLYYKRDYVGAIEALERALKLDPGAARARAVLSRVYDAQGRPEQALDAMRQAIEMSNDAGVSWRIQLIRLHAAAGRRDEAQEQFEAFSRDAERRQLRVADEHLAYLYLALGNTNQAVTHLDRAVRERDPGVLWLAVDPRVDPVRKNPRFEVIIARLGIP
jgi:serine/threonine protein kinase/lipopolysaccharide biosynthesis regulator YciM